MLNLSNILNPWANRYRIIAKGSRLVVPGAGSTIIGPYKRRLFELPQILAFPTNSNSGELWSEGFVNLHWAFLNNAEVDAMLDFSVRFESGGTNYLVDWAILGFAI